uniref:Vav guanine nucleotide exchange factor 3 n=1 Tax=Anabas testudineus TaxID=64144 RepID=A0A7N6B5U1_ANATE
MEYWRQCALWLINCKVLPANHRVTWDSAQVFDLAQTLRDGVLLCHLLNNLKSQSINLKEINLRPQMSQFLCLKNIRTFLAACSETFGMKKSELFEAFDLFDVRDFGKVSENEVEDEEDLYDCVYNDEEGGEIYEDLMKTEVAPPPQVETDIRSCCLTEIKQTEEKYTETLELFNVLFQDLVKVHKNLLLEIQDSIHHRSAQNLYQIFITFKERLLIYGRYCSHVETAIATLDDICKNREDVRMKLEECSKRANYGKFTLRDLLVVPMQRVLKYHLLLQELVKHTHDATEKSDLRTALDAMKDLAQYVNEVKRDNETLREIDQYQKSIENLNHRLTKYGRPKGDGEVRVASVDKRAKQDRHIFLFDAAVIVCKRRGDIYEMKEVIDLHLFKITNNPTSDKENRKWSHGFYLTHNQGQSGFEFFFKTKELKKKWLEQFGMAISNIRPENASNNFHEFRMHTFERITSCNSCHMLLRGIFNQGYLCSKCGLGAHKECLGRFGHEHFSCTKCALSLYTDTLLLAGLPKMLVIRNYFGVPSPTSGPPLSIQTGDIIELICADLHSPWWQVRRHIVIHLLQGEITLITYSMAHRYNNDVKHIKILTKEGCFYIAENKKFRSIIELIEYYKHHSLREGFRSLDTTLQFPYREPENAAMQRLNRSAPLLCGLSFVTPAGYSFVPPSSAPFWSVFTPKVIGVAIARYDFSSRDTRELSLQEGDVVKIYTKTGANGWWRGEVNGRVSSSFN